MLKKIKENWEAIVLVVGIELVLGFALGMLMILCFGW
jgi:hypothetical protein